MSNRNQTCALFLILIFPLQAHAQDFQVDFWFRSFIANNHPTIPGYISKTQNGKFVLHAPNIPAPFMDINRLKGTCFTTDQRDFSSAIEESARVGVYIRLFVRGRELKIGQINSIPNILIGDTHNVDCISGKDLVPSVKADSSGTSISDVKSQEFSRNFSIRISAGDPFYKVLGVAVAPKISSEILFVFDVSTKRIKITGTVEDFPWFEGYYRINDGKIKTLIRRTPANEASALSLFDFGLGLHTTNFIEEINLFE